MWIIFLDAKETGTLRKHQKPGRALLKNLKAVLGLLPQPALFWKDLKGLVRVSWTTHFVCLSLTYISTLWKISEDKGEERKKIEITFIKFLEYVWSYNSYSTRYLIQLPR